MAKDKPKVGRPTVMTDEVLDKLRQAFLFGATKEEACAFADIGFRTLYDYIDRNPEFSQEIDKWQQNPILKAKKTVMNSLDDPKVSQWYLERRAKEFKPKQDLTTPILNGIEGINVSTNDSSTQITGPEEEN